MWIGNRSENNAFIFYLEFSKFRRRSNYKYENRRSTEEFSIKYHYIHKSQQSYNEINVYSIQPNLKHSLFCMYKRKLIDSNGSHPPTLLGGFINKRKWTFIFWKKEVKLWYFSRLFMFESLYSTKKLKRVLRPAVLYLYYIKQRRLGKWKFFAV